MHCIQGHVKIYNVCILIKNTNELMHSLNRVIYKNKYSMNIKMIRKI